MKKTHLISLLCILALCLAAVSTAFAAQGDLTIQTSDVLTDMYNIKMTSYQDQLYLVSYGNTEIYCVDTTTGDITTMNVEGLTDEEKAASEEEDIVSDDDDMFFGTFSDTSVSYHSITSNGDLIYLIYSISESVSTEEDMVYQSSLYLAEITSDGDTLTCINKKQITDDQLMEVYDSSSWPREIVTMQPIGKDFIIVSYNDNYDRVMYLLDGSTLTLSPIDLGYVNTFTVYKDRQILAGRFDSSYNNIEYLLYDVDAESTTLVATVDATAQGAGYGLAYLAETDTVYYSGDGALYAVSQLDFENKVSVRSMPTGISCLHGEMLSGNRYAAISSDCIAVRNVSADAATAGKLTIASSNTWLESLTAAYYAFMNANGDTEVFLSSNVSNVLENMMNRDSSVDVYILNSTDEAFDAVYTRGYMSEIKSSHLGMDDMYDFIKNFCYRNGELVCYPIYSYGYCVGINTKALEKIGMTISDIPTNWPDLIALMPELSQKLEDTSYNLFGSWQTQDSVRYSMIRMILEQYYNEQVEMSDTDRGYKTPELLAALEAVNNLDLTALGVSEMGDDEDSEEGWSYDMSDEKEAIIDFYFDYLPAGWYTVGEEPLLLTIDASAKPALAQNVMFVFINPFTQNYDSAVAFIESLAAHSVDQYLYAFTAKDNEPQRYDWYQENITYYEQMIEEYSGYVETAESNEDKVFFQELLDEWTGYMNSSIENDWKIKPVAISSYQALAPMLSVQRFNPLYSESDAGSEIYDLVYQLSLGTITPSDFVTQVDRKVQMMILEGN